MNNFNSVKKTALLILAFCAVFVNNINSQDHSKRGSRPHYCEEYLLYKKTLQSKIWWSGKNMRAENNPGVTDAYGLKNDKKTIYIFREDSAKFYCIWPDEKKMMVFNSSQMTTNGLMGLDIEKSSVKNKEFIGVEEVDGKKCQHWSVTTTSTMQMMGKESSETGCYDYWYYEPWQMPIQTKNGCGFIEPMITLNVQFGPQPESLFELPKGYQMVELPTGGLMEMLTGKPREQNQKDVDATGKAMQNAASDINKQMEELNKKNEGKSETEQIMNALQLLGGSQKKKQ